MGRARFLVGTGAEGAQLSPPVDWQREIHETGVETVGKILVVIVLFLILFTVKALLSRRRAARRQSRAAARSRRGRV